VLELAPNLAPGTAAVWIDAMLMKALANELAMPLRDRYVLLRLNDGLPESLDVVDLLLDREGVETGRRIRNRLSHSEEL
jgi:hypothetical protein